MAHTVIATGTPYEQMGMLKSLFYRWHPLQLTLADFDTSLNAHMFCLGTSGSGKSRFITKLARASIEAGHSLLLADTSQDPFRQVLYYCITEGIDPSRVIILDATEPEIPVPDFQVAYPRPADNVSRPLLFRLCRVTQPDVSTRSVFSTLLPSLLADI